MPSASRETINVGEVCVRFLVREVGEVRAASAGGPPDRAALIEVMRRHGVTPSPA